MEGSKVTDRGAQRGFSLVETMVGVAIAGVLAGAVAPGFDRAIERRRVEAVALQLETDVQLARSLAVSRNESVRLTFGEAEGACYVIHTGNAGGCGCNAAGVAHCRTGAVPLRTVGLASRDDVDLRANASSLTFDPRKGTVTPTATMQVRGAKGAALNQVVNIMGRVRTCSPDAKVSGYRAC